MGGGSGDFLAFLEEQAQGPTLLEMHHEAVPEANPGDNVGFNVKGLSIKDIKRGNVASDAKADPARGCKNFTAQVMVMNHKNGFGVGYSPVVDCHTSHVACKFTKILNTVDRRTNMPPSTRTRPPRSSRSRPATPLTACSSPPAPWWWRRTRSSLPLAASPSAT